MARRSKGDVVSYGRLQQAPDESTQSWREATTLFMTTKNALTDEDAHEMVQQLRRIVQDPEQRVCKPPSFRAGSKGRTSRNIFPFLRLPPEIRNRIYQYALPRRLVQRLRCFATPALSRVSQQLRQETLPVFFYVNTFVAEVKTSFVSCSSRSASKAKANYIRHDHWRFKYLGLVSIAGDVNPLSWLYYAKKALFKNLDIVLLHPYNTYGGHVRHESAVLSLRFGAQVKITTHVNMDSTRTKLERRYLEKLLRLAEGVMRYHTSVPDSQGLLFRRLESVAETFRYARVEPSKAKNPSEHHLANSAATAHGRRTSGSHTSKPFFVYSLPAVKQTYKPMASFIMAEKETNHKIVPSKPTTADEFDLPDAESYFTTSTTTVEDEFDLPDAESYFFKSSQSKPAAGDDFDLSDAEGYFDL